MSFNEEIILMVMVSYFDHEYVCIYIYTMHVHLSTNKNNRIKRYE